MNRRIKNKINKRCGFKHYKDYYNYKFMIKDILDGMRNDSIGIIEGLAKLGIIKVANPKLYDNLFKRSMSFWKRNLNNMPRLNPFRSYEYYPYTTHIGLNANQMIIDESIIENTSNYIIK